jgi:hypothetical protein
MKKFNDIAFTLFALLILAASCKDQKTYADYLKDESKAIDRFISKNNFTILKNFPDNGVFKANEFYKDPNSGVYYNIVNYGDTTKKVQLGEEIYIRFSGLKYFMVDDSTTYNNLNPNTSPFPQTLVYRGALNVSTRSVYESATPGWITPVPYIGQMGEVKMLIPFTMGSSYDRSQYQPTYYESVQYRFENAN